MTVYKHFVLDNDQDGVVWLAIDVAGKSVNVMAGEVMGEMAQITAELTANPRRSSWEVRQNQRCRNGVPAPQRCTCTGNSQSNGNGENPTATAGTSTTRNYETSRRGWRNCRG